jgi:caffeoyl-CoA O-methyltransferase
MLNDLAYYEVQQYAESCTSSASELLQELYCETVDNVPMPQMISGNLQGRILAMLSQMIKPSSILEIGTFTGYSTICLAEGLTSNGIIHTIERNRSLEEIHQKYFKKAGLENKIKVHIGDALSILSSFELETCFDLIFIDADKKNVLAYYDAVMPLLKSGGFIAVDNMLWKGKVLNNDNTDKRTSAILSLTDFLLHDSRVEVVFLPVRDGIMLIRKKY